MSGSLSLLLQAASTVPPAPSAGYGRFYLDADGVPHVELNSGEIITGLNSALTVNAQSGASYTLAASDAGGIIVMSSSEAGTLNVPLNADVPIPVGSFLFVTQQGSGEVTVAISAGGVLATPNGEFATQGQFGILFKIASDTWSFVLMAGSSGGGSGDSGTVTSVGMVVPPEFSVSGSPVTASGTISLAKISQSANQIWAGPPSGAAATPVFRSLVAADLPQPTIRSVAETSDTIQAADNQNTVYYTASSGVTTILPSNATVAGLTGGFSVDIVAGGAGVVSFATEGSDVLIFYSPTGASTASLSAEGKAATVRLLSVDGSNNRTWVASGALT
jgi:hypothetical protein